MLFESFAGDVTVQWSSEPYASEAASYRMILVHDNFHACAGGAATSCTLTIAACTRQCWTDRVTAVLEEPGGTYWLTLEALSIIGCLSLHVTLWRGSSGRCSGNSASAQ